MTTHSIRCGPGSAGRPAALAMLMLTAALLVPPARAADAATDGGTAEGWKKVLAFAHCAANVFRAATPADWAVAFTDCGRLFLEEPPWPGGGGQP